MCLKLSFDDFLAETNAKNAGEDPKALFRFLKTSEIWPERVYFNVVDNFLRKSLTMEEYESLLIIDVSPKYFSFQSICSDTNFLEAISKFLEPQVSLGLAKKVYEYCQAQNAWPAFLDYNKNSNRSNASSVPSLCSTFDPLITSTQNGKLESLENVAKENKSQREQVSRVTLRKKPMIVLQTNYSNNNHREVVMTTAKKRKKKISKENMPLPIVKIKMEDCSQDLEVRRNRFSFSLHYIITS